MLAALAIFLAPEITIDLTRPGAPVPAALFGTNLPIQTPISTDITDFFKKQGVTLYRYPNGGSPGWHFQTGTFDFPESQGDNPCALRSTRSPAPSSAYAIGSRAPSQKPS